MKEEKTTKQSLVNQKQYCGVIFSDEVWLLLMTKRESLSKDELTEGLKTNENLHQAIAEAYNNTEKYNDNAYPHLNNCRGHPQTFAGSIIWEQSKSMLRDLVKE